MIWLVRVVGQSSFEGESSHYEEDVDQDEKSVSHSEAVEYFNKHSSWTERQNHVDAIQNMQL